MRGPCKTCSDAESSNFYPSNKSRCKTCLLARNRAWVRDNRSRHLDYQKKYQATEGRSNRRLRYEWFDTAKARPCEDCGGQFPPECMDFDHTDPATKEFSVSYGAVAGLRVERVMAEIAKCRLLCANCHRIRTAKQHNRKGAY
jgi:hypothetical protein